MIRLVLLFVEALMASLKIALLCTLAIIVPLFAELYAIILAIEVAFHNV